MRTFILTLILMVMAMVSVAGQESADAIILSHVEEFKMNSRTSGTDKVHVSILVNNKDGLDAATFVVYTDYFRSLGSFGGEVVLQGGKKVKLSKKDLSFVSLSTGLADDCYAVGYVPSYNYPFTVTYDYTVDYKNGVDIFPVFDPVNVANVGLASAKYSLILPEGMKIARHDQYLEYSVETVKGKDVHTWILSQPMKPLVREHLMKLESDTYPLVFAGPLEFTLGGIEGRQSNWEELASWLCAIQTKVDDLPASEVDKVRELTEGADSDYEIVSRLYSYLREKTRYVSISLGIGGLRPLPASHVAKNGFGDCKGLSNYLKCLLKVAGVDSYYYVINTDQKKFFKDICSVSQMNHVMLAVPLKENKDTLFVECTNPSYPLGYRHSDCAGHDILMLDGKSGRKVTVGGYPDSLSRKIREAKIVISADGSAKIDIKDRRMLDYSETFIDFGKRKPDSQVKTLVRDWNVQPEDVRIVGVKDNFKDYLKYGREYVPEAEVDFSMTSRKYANASGDRIFFPMNPLAVNLYYQRSARVNRVYLDSGYTLAYDYTVVLPEGYKVENLPEDVTVDDVWGTFVSSARVDESDSSVLHVSQSFTAKPFDEDKSMYPSYREFAKKVNKAYSAKVVLSRQ
ncbi:MAG: DUF3857 domain-containing protein [Bacteroidales bacterium]|nr:DUF3857 domain-containing protein [Bacteroidales bacterium]